MRCKNEVSYYIPVGYDHREHFVLCGNTDPHGGQAICEQCASNPAEVERCRLHEENAAADSAWLGGGEL